MPREASAGGVVIREQRRRAGGGRHPPPRARTCGRCPRGTWTPARRPSRPRAREVREETGLTATLVAPLGEIRYVYQFRGSASSSASTSSSSATRRGSWEPLAGAARGGGRGALGAAGRAGGAAGLQGGEGHRRARGAAAAARGGPAPRSRLPPEAALGRRRAAGLQRGCGRALAPRRAYLPESASRTSRSNFTRPVATSRSDEHGRLVLGDLDDGAGAGHQLAGALGAEQHQREAVVDEGEAVFDGDASHGTSFGLELVERTGT